MGSPEVEWAIDYERSLIPVGTRFPKKGDVYEPATDVEIGQFFSRAVALGHLRKRNA